MTKRTDEIRARLTENPIRPFAELLRADVEYLLERCDKLEEVTKEFMTWWREPTRSWGQAQDDWFAKAKALLAEEPCSKTKA